MSFEMQIDHNMLNINIEGETTKIPVFPSQSETTALKQMLRVVLVLLLVYICIKLFSFLKVTQRKLHLAQSNLADCEQNRERRLKIIRKTHQSALALKQTLIQELQDIVAEKDEIINSLNTKLQDSQVDVEVKPCMNESEVFFVSTNPNNIIYNVI